MSENKNLDLKPNDIEAVKVVTFELPVVKVWHLKTTDDLVNLCEILNKKELFWRSSQVYNDTSYINRTYINRTYINETYSSNKNGIFMEYLSWSGAEKQFKKVFELGNYALWNQQNIVVTIEVNKYEIFTNEKIPESFKQLIPVELN